MRLKNKTKVLIRIRKRFEQEVVYNNCSGEVICDCGDKAFIELDKRSKKVIRAIYKDKWTTQPYISKINLVIRSKALSIL